MRRTIAGATNKNTLRKQIQDAWIQFIINYSARNLTKNSDKLIAIEGIVNAVASVLDEKPVAVSSFNPLVRGRDSELVLTIWKGYVGERTLAPADMVDGCVFSNTRNK